MDSTEAGEAESNSLYSFFSSVNEIVDVRSEKEESSDKIGFLLV